MKSQLRLLTLLWFISFSQLISPNAWAGANQWTSIGPYVAEINTLAIDSNNSNTIYAATERKGVYKSTNKGGSWSLANNGLSDLRVYRIAIDNSNSQNLYAATYSGLYKSINGGDNWVSIKTDGLENTSVAIDYNNSSVIYYGTRRSIFKSTDSGNSWNQIFRNDQIYSINDIIIDPSNPSTLYACNTYWIYKSTDGGNNWKPAGKLDSVYSLAVDPSNPSTIYTANISGGVYKSSDGGENWVSAKNGLTSNYNTSVVVDPLNSNTIYTASNNQIFKSLNAGANWSIVYTGEWASTPSHLTIDPKNPNFVYMANEIGIVSSSDGGNTWYPSNNGITDRVVNVLATDPSNSSKLFAGTDNLFVSGNSGESWNTVEGNYYQWSVQSIAIELSNSVEYYLGFKGGNLKKTLNSGKDWLQVDFGLPKNNNGNGYNYVNTIIIVPTNTSTMYAQVTSLQGRGGVYKSINGGDSWNAVSAGMTEINATSMVIDPINPSIIYVGVNGSGVYKSSDAGETWKAINNGLTALSVNTLTISQSKPSVLYAGTFSGIYKSIDSGEKWGSLNHGLPPAIINYLAINPSDTDSIFAGTSNGIFRYISNIDKWIPFSNNLTNKNILHLLFGTSTPLTLYAGTNGDGAFKAVISPKYPPAVTTSKAVTDKTHDATLNGAVFLGGLPTTAQFEYGLTTAYGNTAAVTLSPNDGSTSQNVSTTINGLQPGAIYHYRLTATNSEGTGVGNDDVFTVGDSYKLHGLNFSPILNGQNGSTPISLTQLEARMGIIKNNTEWVRTFGASNGLEQAGAITHKLGLKIAMGAWISTDLAANETEINNVIAAANRGEVDIVIIGSEVVLRAESGTTPFPSAESKIIEYLNRVKNAIPANIPVTYADTYNTLLNHPNLVAACRDVLFVNYYPYWEGVRVDKAMLDINTKHQRVVAIAGGKKVIVSEAGWPSAGNKNGDALPTLDNESFYFLNFVSWARSNNIDYFYFEGLDSVWKSQNPQLPVVESHWGVWDGSDNMKYGMEKVFNNNTMEDNWTLVDGAGQPSLEFTYIPTYANQSQIYGKAKHINPADYKVALYIYIPNIGTFSGWWIKPYSDDRRNITLDAGGEWNALTVTGGSDGNATKFAAFLVPKTYTIPAFGATLNLPAELYQNAVANVEVTRPLAAFPVNVAISGTGLSTVTSDIVGISCGHPNYDCSENYAADSTVVLTATPYPGYKFTGWTGDCSGTDLICTLKMNAAKTVGANFVAKIDQNIKFGPVPSVVVNGIGTISATGGASGNPVILTTQTTGKCSLSNISVTGNTSSATVTGISLGTCTIAANQAGNVNYNDAPQATQSFEVTIGKVLTVVNANIAGGTVTSDTGGIACGATCSANFATGVSVKLTAIPVDGYQFSGWGGACLGHVGINRNTCTLTMDAAKSCTAKFEVFKKKRRPSWRGLLSQ